MSVTAPPRPGAVSSTEPVDRAELEALVEALIEEARQRARRRRRRNAALVLLAAVLTLGAYLGISRVLSDGGSASAALSAPAAAVGGSSVRNGPLTIFYPSGGAIKLPDVSWIATVGPGVPRTIWRCPHDLWCGQAVSFAWAPDGRRLAFSLDEIGGTSGYVGLHVIDTATGKDRHIPAGAPSDLRDAGAAAYLTRVGARLGCWPPSQLAWSPDGTTLAYPCGTFSAQVPGGRHFISLLALNGSGFTALPTPTEAFWPSWSADGRRIVYATKRVPEASSRITIVRLDGTDRTLLVRGATAPAWSPDGRTIAVQTSCGIRLLTPGGEDVTPASPREGCDAIGVSGPPEWSPDGTKLAMETKDGIFVMDATGAHFHRVSRAATPTWYGNLPGRPSWRPVRS